MVYALPQLPRLYLDKLTLMTVDNNDNAVNSEMTAKQKRGH